VAQSLEDVQFVHPSMSATSIALEDLGLQCIEPGVFWPMNPISRGKITRLDIKGNMFDTVPKNTLNAFPNLTYLALINNKLVYIPVDFFTELKSLKSLFLNQNSLTQMSDYSVLNALKYLDISWNKLTHIQIEYLPSGLESLVCYLELFNDWSHIQGLTGLLGFSPFYNRNLGNPPAGFFNGWNLKTLNLQTCTLTVMPDLSDIKTKLKSFTLSDNKIVNIPDNYFSAMTSLETLRLTSNSLTNIPNTFSGLVNLRSIELSSNSGLITVAQMNIMKGSGYFSVLTNPLALYLKTLGTALTNTEKDSLQTQLSVINDVTVYN
jgi:Leucine-rich repeat (LRR) protein